MDKEQLKKVQADTPLSITDFAPPVITLDCGAESRIPGGPDYRILGLVEDAVVKCKSEMWDDELDTGLVLLFCSLHTTKKAMGELWKKARKPLELYREAKQWFACQPGMTALDAINELMEFQAELEGQAELDSGDDLDDAGKKKTG